jgi:hypothetical protein
LRYGRCPHRVPLATLVKIAGLRWATERCRLRGLFSVRGSAGLYVLPDQCGVASVGAGSEFTRKPASGYGQHLTCQFLVSVEIGNCQLKGDWHCAAGSEDGHGHSRYPGLKLPLRNCDPPQPDARQAAA